MAKPRQSKAYRQAARRFKGLPCVYCGAPSTTVEHLVPVVAGGGDTSDNLAPCCGPCNYSRGGRLSRRPARGQGYRSPKL